MDSSDTESVTQGSLTYLLPTNNLKTEKPYMSSIPFTHSGGKTSNFTEMEYKVPIRDVRNLMDKDLPEFNTNGFQYVQHRFRNQPADKIEGPDHPYLVEVAEFLKSHLAAKDVIVYDCNVGL